MVGQDSVLPTLPDMEGDILPRDLPFVGFWRHAPPTPQQTEGELEQKRQFKGEPDALPPAEGSGRAAATKRSQETLLKLLRESPYVGFCRHAPPTPTLRFCRDAEAPFAGGAPPPLELLPEAEEATPWEAASDARSQLLPGSLPEIIWTEILSQVVEPCAIHHLARVASCFPMLLADQVTWQGLKIVLGPGCVAGLAPVLHKWLLSWERASKLVVPRSTQLQAEISRLAPHLEVEVQWRFSTHAKGQGLEVIQGGAAVRRVDEEQVVVLGDAPLVVGAGRAPYIEVQIEAFEEELAGDGVNDFGIGLTACDPETLEELGDVAAEVPSSWVVDFTASMVCLSINNCEEGKGHGASSGGLRIGDRVGVRISQEDHALEVFINGSLKDRLHPPARKRVPRGASLFPVLDLYGHVSQLSRTQAEGPCLASASSHLP
mmetsp:Transcript_122361/g.305411  ORF Transcript_122361/g.305411 Transcript_122361/m.305411 type:complete len:432 (+) Transcript_122361:224-1519(+)